MPLGATVLLEQSSGHYNQAGMQRKFTFHMLIAGHMFWSTGQQYHAIRCFASAMYVYHGGDRFWRELFNHLLSRYDQQWKSQRQKSAKQFGSPSSNL